MRNTNSRYSSGRSGHSPSRGRNSQSSAHGRSFGSGQRSGGRYSGGRSQSRGNSRFKLTPLDISTFINKAAVITEKVEHFVPEHQFSDFKINSTILQTLEKNGYKQPTPIQDKIISHILNGRDVVGLANTGTGKTAAFLIPLIHKIANEKHKQILIMTPTRELALQIDQEFRIFSKGLGLYSVCCVGGANINMQIRDLRYKNHLIIGTPGRMLDLINRRCLKLGEVETIVLDEADQMLDMGFVNDIKLIMSNVPAERHTLCFAATMSRTIEDLINKFLKNPITISVKTQATSKNVEQDIVKLRGKDKVDILHDILNDPELKKVLVFGRTKHGVEKLSKKLITRGFKAESIHGNKSQGQRQRALKRFKDNQVQVLVATDVAARGLDIDSVTHVINYDLPATYDDYIHRIGRTGRGTKKGKALTFVE
ncbi:MAG: DEAD/DEAH box helicase [Candidatus Moranbacteria bacterium]|nr:DEAD/DEAH box helicase [Candidatus Moranbacteria bacterium]